MSMRLTLNITILEEDYFMSVKKEKLLYEQMYGDIPDEPIDIIAHILGKRVNNKALNDDITNTANKVKRMKKIRIEFTMYKVWKPSARPRVNGRGPYMRMYVPHAAENGEWFEDFYKSKSLPFIDTPCEISMVIYEHTPSSFSIKNKVLAELGIIRPWRRTGDFDNYAKSIADAIQHGMLADDCLIYESSQSLRYSAKPRAIVTITYYAKHPDTILFPQKKG